MRRNAQINPFYSRINAARTFHTFSPFTTLEILNSRKYTCPIQNVPITWPFQSESGLEFRNLDLKSDFQRPGCSSAGLFEFRTDRERACVPVRRYLYFRWAKY